MLLAMLPKDGRMDRLSSNDFGSEVLDADSIMVLALGSRIDSDLLFKDTKGTTYEL